MPSAIVTRVSRSGAGQLFERNMSHADALKPIVAIEKVAVARRQAESTNTDLSTLIAY
ncbi:hypothetical protein EC957_005701 [Mortierella hygrophila]|uniref:Uncharacterized protein n=1 Tax=Mortierella hygrophila TaxID=979708 RepID=A0A9P6K6K1_9FUNG|nr:hypothetical protein EC957_005701 [Mortierella hygrophila]